MFEKKYNNEFKFKFSYKRFINTAPKKYLNIIKYVYLNKIYYRNYRSL